MEGETHVLVFPYSVISHINPMLQFSKRLASKGVKSNIFHANHSIIVEIISDGFEKPENSEGIEAYLEHFKLNILVYDSVLPWALSLSIGRQLGLDGVEPPLAAFFTQSCVVKTIYYHARQGTIQMPLEEGSSISLPSMPSLGINDLPSFLSDKDLYLALLNFVLNQFSNFQEAKWILCNTFDNLEYKAVNWMVSQQWPVKIIGPAIPSMYLDKQLEDDKEYGLHLFKPDVDACIKWLDTKNTHSVMYELTWGQKKSNCYFLWVVRETEQKKLPTNILQETVEKGLVVSWCPQLEVLAHKAIGCFMTHWVPLVAMPQWMDQTTNAKFIVDVWKVGVRVKLDERGIATKEEIELGKEMKKNSVKWKELAREAMDEGGTSDKNIEEFVAKLVCS
ncbi:hypothetical protein ACB092_04G032500 [Castanea dentata]